MNPYVEENRRDLEETDWAEIKHMLWVVWLWWLHAQFALTVVACFRWWDEV